MDLSAEFACTDSTCLAISCAHKNTGVTYSNDLCTAAVSGEGVADRKHTLL